MAQSLVKLTLESNQYERNLRNAQKQLNDFTRSIGINMKSLSGMAVAAGAVTGAMKVMKDAFFKSETALDEWGRTVESSKSLYSGFLSALNNSDISGFLGKMNDIVSAAREAYDAMDDLGTYKAFSRGRTAGLRSDYSNALNEYKLNPTAENKKALKTANDALVAEMQVLADKYKTNYDRQLNNLGIERLLQGQQLNEFMNLFRSGDYDKLTTLKSGYKGGRGLNAGAQYWYGDRVYDGKIQDRFSGKWRVMDEEERKKFEFARVLNQVNDKQIDYIQALDEQYKMTLDAINNQNRQYNRLAGNNGNAGGSTGGGKTGGSKNDIAYAADSIMAQEKLVAELTQKWKTAGDAVRDDYKVQLDEAKKKLEEMTNPMGPQMKLWQGDIDDMLNGTPSIAGGIPQIGQGLENLPEYLSPLQQINAEIERWQELMEYAPTSDAYQVMKQHLEELMQKQKEFTGETETDVRKASGAWSDAATVIGTVGSVLKQIDDPAAQIAAIVAQGIASLVAAYGDAMAKDQSSKFNIYQFIATAAAATIQMAAQIQQIHSLTGYEHGGEIKGNSYSGDNIPIMANAGELVLTKAMQGNLASQLQGNGLGNLNLTATIYGEDIRLSLNNNGLRTGRGEYITTKFQ